MDNEDAPEITPMDALKKLRAFISYDCKIMDLAKRFNVSRAHMSDILAGKGEMTDEMLKAVGVKRVVVYVLDEKKVA